MGDAESAGGSGRDASSDSQRLPDASTAPPPLLDGIVRVKVPPEKIQPFLAKAPLFRNASREVVAKVASLLHALECAEGSEIVTAAKANGFKTLADDGVRIVKGGVTGLEELMRVVDLTDRMA